MAGREGHLLPSPRPRRQVTGGLTIVTTDDIAAAIRAKWAASGLNAVVPAAGVYVGRVAEKTALPYAVLTVRLTATESTSGQLFLQTFEASVDAYTQSTPPAGSVQAATILAFLGTPGDPAGGLSLSSGKVVHALLTAGDGTNVTQVRIDGVDVHKVSTRFTILTQTSR